MTITIYSNANWPSWDPDVVQNQLLISQEINMLFESCIKKVKKLDIFIIAPTGKFYFIYSV